MKKILYVLVSFIVAAAFVSCDFSSSSDEPENHIVNFYDAETLLDHILVEHGKPIPQDVIKRIEEDHSIMQWTKGAGGEPFDESEAIRCDLDLYAVTSCIAAGTEITMYDGSRKAVENLEIGDMIRTFDHESGTISSAPVYDIMKTEKTSGALELKFDDNSSVKIVNEHGFFSMEENRYVFISKNNVRKYLNTSFYNADSGKFTRLTGYQIIQEPVDAYSIVSAAHLNHVADGMLAMTDGIMKVICNVFEFENDLRIDQQKKAENIQKYGLIQLEDMKYYSAEDYEAFCIKYFKIAIGKGFITEEELDFLAGILVNM